MLGKGECAPSDNTEVLEKNIDDNAMKAPQY